MALYPPLLSAVTFFSLPSGKVTVTVLPASALPITVNIPFVSTSKPSIVGSAGGVVSVKVSLAGLDVLPALSVAVTLTSPLV